MSYRNIFFFLIACFILRLKSDYHRATQTTTGGGPCVYMEIGQTTAPSGLWSLTDCSGEEMLGICEFE